ncbi:MAG: hypothetical protein RIF39_00045, partial [Cyclobacteriaceae bacterium]
LCHLCKKMEGSLKQDQIFAMHPSKPCNEFLTSHLENRIAQGPNPNDSTLLMQSPFLKYLFRSTLLLAIFQQQLSVAPHHQRKNLRLSELSFFLYT